MSLSATKIFDIFLGELQTKYTMEKSCSLILKFYKDHLSLFTAISISDTLKYWGGIDSKSSILLIILSQELLEKKTRKICDTLIIPDFIDKEVMFLIYKKILSAFYYECENNGITFPKPSWKAIETIVGKFKKLM